MSAQPDEMSFDAEIQSRIRIKVEKAIPDGATRLDALRFLAYAIENADEERSDAWCLQETRRGLKLMAGRLQVCKLTRGALQVSVLGPIPEHVGTELGIREDESEESQFIPGGLWVRFPPERAARALDLLRDPYDKFVDQAMARVRRKSLLQTLSAADLMRRTGLRRQFVDRLREAIQSPEICQLNQLASCRGIGDKTLESAFALMRGNFLSRENGGQGAFEV